MTFISPKRYKDIYDELKQKEIKIKKFYRSTDFLETLYKAFNFTNMYTLKELIRRWNDAIDDEVDWAAGNLKATKEETYQIKRIHLDELVKLINLGDILMTGMENKFLLEPTISFILSLGILYGNLIFEQTCMHLKIREI